MVSEVEGLLPPIQPHFVGRKCLVLDLDETLVHSSFKPVPNADYIIPVEIEDTVHQVYVLKRPGVDEFMKRMGPLFEVVIFTASVAKYADPVLDLLDIHKVCHHRLFREACVCHRGNYVKDLGKLGRPLKDIIIVDNSPASYLFNPENAVPIDSWFDDPNDTELLDLIPFLEDIRCAETRFLVSHRSDPFFFLLLHLAPSTTSHLYCRPRKKNQHDQHLQKKTAEFTSKDRACVARRQNCGCAQC